MFKPLVVNRRLMYGVYPGGEKKHLQAGENCPCCEESPGGAGSLCDSPCLQTMPEPIPGTAFGWCNPFGSEFSEIASCAPNSIYVKIAGLEADGLCTELPDIGSVKVNGTGNIVGCLRFVGTGQTGDADDFNPFVPPDINANYYHGIVNAPGWRIRFWYNTDCSGTPAYTAEDRIAVTVGFYRLDQSIPANVGKYGVRVLAYSCLGWLIFSSESTYSATGALYDPFLHAVPSGSAVVEPCKGFTVNGDGKAIHTVEMGVAVPPPNGVDILVGGGTATVKFCCEEPTTLSCRGPAPEAPPRRWFKLYECNTGTFTGKYVSEVQYKPGTGYFLQPGNICARANGDYIEQKDHPSPGLTVIEFPNCAACTAVAPPAEYRRARFCGSGDLSNVYAGGAVEGRKYILPGACIYFDFTDPTYDEIPEPHGIGINLDEYDHAESCEACAGSTPCRTDSSGCLGSYVGTFTPGPGLSGTGITAKSGTLYPDPAAPAQYRYCQNAPDVDPDCITGIYIFCSGAYEYAVVSDATEAVGYSITFRRLRTAGACPPQGVYEYFSTSIPPELGDPSDSTFSLS